MKNKVLNFLGTIVRDIIVLFSTDVIEFTAIDNKYIYKSWIPFIFSIGRYRFLPEKEFYKVLR